jgi:predicted transcriptional regulator
MDARGVNVSESELEVLKVLWEHAAGTVRAINTILRGQGRRWAYTTVQTLLQRLESKGYVHSDRSGPAHIYRAKNSSAAVFGSWPIGSAMARRRLFCWLSSATAT